MLRKEHVILAEIQRRIPELEKIFVAWDCPVPGGCSMYRPDMLWDMLVFWFAIEVDEDGHPQPDGKYPAVQKSMNGRSGILLRVNPDEPGSKMCRSLRTSNGDKTFQASIHFNDKMDVIERVIRQVVF
jgi:hypothetical protein